MKEEIINRNKINITFILLPLILMALFGLIMIKTKLILFLEISWTIGIYILFVFLIHEVLHGLGFKIIGKVDLKDIKITFNMKYFAPYCVCKDLKLSKIKYIWIMLLPNIILSVLTLTIMIKSNNILWAMVMGYVVGCGAGDYYLVLKAIKYSKKVKLESHPMEVGFYIYE